MQVDNALLKHLANLSRLHFSEPEFEALRGEMTDITGFVEKLNELDTTGVEPLMHLSDTEDVLRDDHVQGSVPAADAFKNAAQHNAAYFTVPKVIQQ